MRELLFRGRFKVNKFRWNGTPREYEFIESKTHHISAINFNNNGDISHVVIPYKDTCITLFPDYFTTFDIQQYTGIKDDRDVKIFESDCVEITIHDDKICGIVDFVDGIHLAIDKLGAKYSLISDSNTFVEVVGNIHDNKNLIK